VSVVRKIPGGLDPEPRPRVWRLRPTSLFA
jgi:hypothetical protein